MDRHNIWEAAVDNTVTIKIPLNVYEKYLRVCKTCGKPTPIEMTDIRQQLGNVYQSIVKCKPCGKYFVMDEDKYDIYQITLRKMGETLNEAKSNLKKEIPAKDLAMKHHQFIGTIEKEIEMGVEIEYEHTKGKGDKDKKLARAIATHHIDEFPDYYSNPDHGLKASEKKLKNEGVLSVFNDLLNEKVSKYQK